VKTTLRSPWDHLEVLAKTVEQVATGPRIFVSPIITMVEAKVAMEETSSRASATPVECLAIWQKTVLRKRRMQANVPMVGSPSNNMAM
jgi:hypothetical protein